MALSESLEIGKYYQAHNGSFVYIMSFFVDGTVSAQVDGLFLRRYQRNGTPMWREGDNLDIVQGPVDEPPLHVYQIIRTTTEMIEVQLPTPNYVLLAAQMEVARIKRSTTTYSPMEIYDASKEVSKEKGARTRMDRSRQLRGRDFSTLSQWEHLELLYMLPDPENPQDDGSGLAETFFLLMETGFSLDSLLMVVNDAVRSYLLENRYVIEIPGSDGTPYYSWGDVASRWDQRFES